MSCDDVTRLAPEIALGTIDGEERADALRHLATCAECRREVDQLTRVADELLMIAPVQEPPVGFESRVIGALGFDQQPARRSARRRWLGRLAPVVVAVAVTAAVLTGIQHDDALQSAPLTDGAGARAGVCFGHGGKPSWMLVSVDAAHRDQVDSAVIVTRDHRTIPLRGFRLSADGTWGGTLPVKLSDVSAMRLLGDQPGEVLQAYVT